MVRLNIGEKAFTLIELIIVIAIMGVILILALPQIANLQNANKNKKYDAYYSSAESAAKLYMDSRAKDLFGSNSSGCVTVKYSDLKKQNLIKDFGSSDVTCSRDDETYVEVRKANDNFLYSTSVVCRDSKDSKKVVYEKKDLPEEPCINQPDKAGPTVNITPNEHDWVQTKNLKIKIKITDAYTLNKNIGILYYWTNSSDTKVSKDYTYSYKNKKGVESVSYQIPTKNIPTASGEYKLVVRQWISSSTNGIQDILGNDTVGDTVAGLYKIDNVKPTCGSNDGKTTWTKDDFTIHQYCSDDASGCTENPYSKKFTTTTVTDTFTIKDKAGNTNTCEVNVYLDKTNPTNPKGGAIGTVSGSNKNASIKTEVSGSTDSHSGFKRYLYLVTNSNSKPGKFDSGFTTSKAFTRSCGTSYYAWAVAEDNVGNRSDVISLGSTKDGANKYSSWSSCSKKCGGGKQSRTNTCALVTNNLVQDCNTHSCKPATPTIYNPTGGNWVNYNFSLTVNTTTESSSIGYWQYSYDQASWITYANSATNNFQTTPFSAERNQPVYIRVCSKDKFCSDSASTYIRIDKTPPTITVYKRVNGDAGLGPGWNFHIWMEYYDNGSGLHLRDVVWYTFGTSRNQQTGYYHGARTGGDRIGTWGRTLRIEYHKICDVVGNCTTTSGSW